MKSKFVLLLISLVLIIVLVGCSSNSAVGIKDVIDESENLYPFELLEISNFKESIQPSGISYTLLLTNNSKAVIAQNSIYVCLPISDITRRKYSGQGLMKKFRHNKVNIKPGESVTLSAFMPKDLYELNPLIISDEPYLSMHGYMKILAEENQFSSYGPVSYYDKSFKSRAEERVHTESRLRDILTKIDESNGIIHEKWITDNEPIYSEMISYGSITLDLFAIKLEESRIINKTERVMIKVCEEILDKQMVSDQLAHWYRDRLALIIKEN